MSPSMKKLVFGILAAGLVAAAPVGAGAQEAAPAPKPAAKAPAAPKAAPRATAADLDEAYKREFAFLEAERNSLQARIKKLAAEQAEKVAAAKAEIERLQNQALGTSTQADRLLGTMADAERKVESAEEGASVLASVLAQAATRLEKANVKLPEAKEGDQAAQLVQVGAVFDNAIRLLGEYGQVRKEPGEFFGADGTKQKGTIVQIGRVASFGVSDQHAGPLAPAGDGQLKVWKSPIGAEAARAVASGTWADPLPLFIYENLDANVEEQKGKTILQTIRAGGVIGWVLVFMAGFVVLLFLGRVFILARAAGNTEKLVDTLEPLVESGKVDEGLDIARHVRSAPGRVLLVVLKNIRRPREQLDDATSEALLREESKLDRFGSAILVCAAVGPLLGLLGTVTGMISTFDVITEFGTGNPKLLSGGISEALITTEFGLIVAIPALLLGNLMNGWASRIKDDMEKGALRLGNVANGIKVRELQQAVAQGRRTGSQPTTEAAIAS
jgi:biopolymer transport protein ExbB